MGCRGFIQDTGNRDPDEVAEDYLYELIDRSLVQVAKVKTNGGLKTCQVHDLLRDLCILKSKEDKVLEVCTDNNILIPTKPRRLSIHSKMGNYISSSNNDHSCIRSLFLFDPDFNVSRTDWKWLSKGFKLVRVLEIRPTWLEIPSNLGNFIHLRYLRIETDCVSFVPTSILNLWNLQTIDLGVLRYLTPISFPVQMWKLKHLRHLHTPQPIKLRGSCSGSDEKMWNLQAICSIVLNKQAKSLIKKGTFPNLKSLRLVVAYGYKGELPKLLQSLQQSSHLNKLEIIFLDRNDTRVEDNVRDIVERNNDCKPQELLQSLGQFNCLVVLHIKGASDLLTCGLAFPPNVTELTLSGIYYITDDGMNGLRNHTKLKILRLSGTVSYDEDSFDLNCVEDSFPQLEVFEMKYLKVVKWKLDNGGMQRLQSVTIVCCKSLDNLPNELWSLSGLRKVQVSYPSEQMTAMLRNLKINNEVQLVIEC